jgi:tetratricopeptide (TPR) repeat protein
MRVLRRRAWASALGALLAATSAAAPAQQPETFDPSKFGAPAPKSCFDKTDDPRRVGALCDAAIRSGTLTDEQLASATLRRGQAWAATGKASDRAMADYDAALRLNPGLTEAYVSRGLLYRTQSDVDRAIADYSAALAIDPRYAAAWVNRGTAWRAKGDLDKAISDYNSALAVEPDNALAFGNRCNAWRDKGEPDRAIADCTAALQRMPRFASALNNRGRITATHCRSALASSTRSPTGRGSTGPGASSTRQ